MSDLKSLLKKAEASQRQLSPSDIRRLCESQNNITLIDVRESNELIEGKLIKAVHIPRGSLERQILHTVDRVGSPKVLSAVKTLAAFSPETNVQTFEERLTPANIDKIFSGFDLVLDGSDNFQTRYLINDACVRHSKACVHG